MIDAHDLQEIERLTHILGRPLLARMSDGLQPEPACAGKDTLELRRRVSLLRGIEPHAQEAITPWQRLREGTLGIRLVEMTQEAEDQSRRHAELPLCILQRAPQTVDDRFESDATASMALRIEEDLGVAHVLCRRPPQVRHGEGVEVLLLQQSLHALVIEVEEVLQIAEVIGGLQGGDAVVPQGDAVAPGELEHQLRLEAALDVDVQLGLRDAGDE